MIEVAPEVADALEAGRAVVALETTLVAHGFPAGAGLEVALEAERRVREGGAVPATVGVLDGVIRVGLKRSHLERLAEAGDRARKAGPRELGVCVARGVPGATTVGGTLAVCRRAGIRFMGTGGIVNTGTSEAAKNGPSFDDDREITPALENEVYSYYGFQRPSTIEQRGTYAARSARQSTQTTGRIREAGGTKDNARDELDEAAGRGSRKREDRKEAAPEEVGQPGSGGVKANVRDELAESQERR